MSNYAAIAKRIRESNSKYDLQRCDNIITVAYKYHMINEKQFMRLDALSVDRSIELDLN